MWFQYSSFFSLSVAFTSYDHLLPDNRVNTHLKWKVNWILTFWHRKERQIFIAQTFNDPRLPVLSMRKLLFVFDNSSSSKKSLHLFKLSELHQRRFYAKDIICRSDTFLVGLFGFNIRGVFSSIFLISKKAAWTWENDAYLLKLWWLAKVSWHLSVTILTNHLSRRPKVIPLFFIVLI